MKDDVPEPSADAAPEPEARAPGVDAAAPSCDGGPVLPDALVGSFLFYDVGCRPPGDSLQEPWGKLGALHIGQCGQTWTGVPDGWETWGRVAPYADAWVYETDKGDLQITLRPLETERGGAPVLLLEAAGAASVWGIRFPDLSPNDEAPPEHACGVQESWKLKSPEGGVLAQGNGPVVPGVEIELAAQWGKSSVSIQDPRLSFTIGDDRFLGLLKDWNGSSGYVRRYLGSAVCMDVDGDIQIERTGASWVVDAEWLVLDVDDADHDGDTQETLVRETRMELAAAACAGD